MSGYTYTAEFASGSRAELTLSLGGMQCEWVPAVPRLSGQRRRRFLAAYRTWRNECVEDFARRTGMSVAVIDV